MSIDEDVARFSKLPILGQLEAEALRVLAFSCDTIELPAETYLFRKGDLSEGGHLLLDGSIGLFDEDRLLRTVHAGSLVGEMSLIVNLRMSHSARTLADCSVLKVKRTLFTRILREYPASALRVREKIADDLTGFAQALKRLESNT